MEDCHPATRRSEGTYMFVMMICLNLTLFRHLTLLVAKILKDATLFFSRSTPNLATVIPAMDVIDERLTNDSLNRAKYDVSIRAALGLAKKTLNRYYNMTDWSEVYRIAMGAYSVLCMLSSTYVCRNSLTPSTQAVILQDS